MNAEPRTLNRFAINIRAAAAVFGIALAIVGVLRFAVSASAAGSVVHLLFGLLGLMAAAGRMMRVRRYFRLATAAYAVLALLGDDVWLHVAVAIAAAYLGFLAPAAPVRTAT